MPLDWLMNSQAPSVLEEAPIIETWPQDVEPEYKPGDKVGGNIPVLFTDNPSAVIKAWRSRKAFGNLYSAVMFRGRLVKAVHYPDCCGCRRCNPRFHGRPPLQPGPDVMYHYDDEKQTVLWCLCGCRR